MPRLTPTVPAPGPLPSAPKMSNKKLEEKYEAPIASSQPNLNPSDTPDHQAQIQTRPQQRPLPQLHPPPL